MSDQSESPRSDLEYSPSAPRKPGTEDSSISSPHKPLKIVVIETSDPRFDLVEANASSSIYHRRAWAKIIETSFGHRAQFILALRGNELVDWLPLFLVHHPVRLWKKLVSSPYEACHGGFKSLDCAAHRALIDKVDELGAEEGAQYLEIRSRFPIPNRSLTKFAERHPFVTTDLILTDEKSNWKMMSKRHRKKIKTAINRNVRIETAQHVDDVRDFYNIVAEHYRKIGVPFSSRKFLEKVWKFSSNDDAGELLVARYNDEIIGGLLLLYSGEELIFKYGAYRKEKKYHNLYASFALFWEAICFGIRAGFKVANFGVTDPENTGLLDFKNRFGADSKNLYFFYKNYRGKAPDIAQYTTKYSFLQEIWKITPGPLIRPVGHQVSKWFC